MSLLEQINNSEYLFLNHLFERDGNELIINVSEGIESEETHDIEVIGVALTGLHNVDADKSCSYNLVFSDYVLYLVTNESFSYLKKEEEFTGKSFRIFSKSHLKEYNEKYTSYCRDEKLIHYQIVCVNHVIDIITPYEPEITFKEKK